MNMAKKDNDDPDRVRPPQRGNDERITGQEKNTIKYNKINTKTKRRHTKSFLYHIFFSSLYVF